jgi:hypothetical protein
MEIKTIRDLKLNILEGIWVHNNINLVIKEDYTTMDGSVCIKEKTDIMYLEENFVRLTESLIIKQVLGDKSIGISYKDEMPKVFVKKSHD